jgi:DNA modification methylase
VTSPPYDNLRTYDGYKSFDFPTIANQLFRVTKPGGVVVWVVGDATINGSETGTSFRQALYFMECGFRLHDTMIYNKNGPSHPESERYHQLFEYMFIFSNGSPKTFNPLKDRKNNWPASWGKQSQRQSDGTLITTQKTILKDYGMRFNVWTYNIGHGYGTSDDIAYKHPATYPEALARDHILSWSSPGDIILDPFAGSGTTLKLAKMLERNYIGIELSADYVNKIILPRLAATPVPLGLQC